MSFGHFCFADLGFWGCCTCRIIWQFFGAAWGWRGQRTISYGILLAKLGVSPYIKNIGLGVLIFMAQQVAKHMAKAGVKNVQFHGTTDAKIEVNYCGSAKHETRV